MHPRMEKHTATHAPATAGHPCVHVASLIVHVRPERLPGLIAWLGSLEGVEIPVSAPEGKLVVVLECSSEAGITTLMQSLGDHPGVLNTALVYHEIIDEEEQSR